AGNLEHCLKNIKSKYPDQNYIIAADNDSLKGKNNTGTEKAIEAAQKYGAKAISPKFTHYEHRRNLSSDFNDLHKIEGIAEVRKQFADENNYKEFKGEIDLSKSHNLNKTNQNQIQHMPSMNKAFSLEK